jgi:seryl-tRNA synthetase
MLNLKWIRDNQEKAKELLALRGITPAIIDQLLFQYQEQKNLTTLIQQLQQARNEKLEIFNTIRQHNNKKSEILKRDLEHIKEKLNELDIKLNEMNVVISILETLPNTPAHDVPIGKSEANNVIIKTVGQPRRIQSPKSHFELGEALGMDFKQTAKISGSRFVTLKASLARLERALVNFMLDIHTRRFQFVEISPPHLVRDLAMNFVGQLPKFEHESFKTTNNFRLIPTAEVSLIGLLSDTIIQEEEFPIRMVASTPCYRSEAGSAGKDTRGMIRMHQFQKVELVSITPQEDSEQEHQYILQAAETILQELELPYRVSLLCTGDMGFAAQKTYDLEVWMPYQNQYREISSCSNCGEFQSRRAKIRYRKIGSNMSQFAHTLNGSGLAIGRCIAAILENYQTSKGTIIVPKALVSYMDGLTELGI